MQYINREQLPVSARTALDTFINETGLVVEWIVARDEQWESTLIEVAPETAAEKRTRPKANTSGR
jgi:hypothetical protein